VVTVSYPAGARSMALSDLRRRLETADLSPSQLPLLEGSVEKLAALAHAAALVAAGFDGSAKVANADPDAPYRAIREANRGSRFFKGKVCLRDVRRLVAAAGAVG
jgi:hypothetical protein